jgi:hypothetical protein
VRRQWPFPKQRNRRHSLGQETVANAAVFRIVTLVLVAVAMRGWWSEAITSTTPLHCWPVARIH